MTKDDDSGGSAILDRPVTRGELLEAMRVTHLALLSQTLATIAQIDCDTDTQRGLAEETIDTASKMTDLMRQMLSRWEAEAHD